MTGVLKRLEEACRAVAERIKPLMPNGVGFCLIMFTYSAGWVTYMATAERDDMIKQLELLLAKWKAERDAAEAGTPPPMIHPGGTA